MHLPDWPQLSACRFFLNCNIIRTTSQTSVNEICRNQKCLPRNDPDARQRLSNQLRVGSSKLQRLASVKSSAGPAPRDLSGLRARTEKRLSCSPLRSSSALRDVQSSLEASPSSLPNRLWQRCQSIWNGRQTTVGRLTCERIPARHQCYLRTRKAETEPDGYEMGRCDG